MKTVAITIEKYKWADTPYALGRNREHDDRSLKFMALPRAATPKRIDTFFGSHAKPLNQEDVGSCTGNALTNFLNTDFARPARAKVLKIGDVFLTEAKAVQFYSTATHIDNIAGSYPPNDTGSSGLAVAKAGVKLGWLQSYSWLFSFTSVQAMIEKQPFIVGTLWTNNMFNCVNGLIKVGSLKESNIAGGHEYFLCGINWTEEVFTFRNSWGDNNDAGWPGCKEGGYFAIKFKEFHTLLDADGDVTTLKAVGM